jgi:glycosyltransferase involved in cell wall biosynthesis
LNIDIIQQNRETDSIVFVGHIIETKGVYELVKVCSYLNEVNNLTLVGPCSKQIKKDLIRIAETRNDGKWLSFTGEIEREQVFDFYRRCAIFCLPSYSEGFPYAILEAMAYACPIIATSVGAIPEMLNNGCGICIEPKNEKKLTSAIESIINNRSYSLQMGVSAHQKVIEKYTMENVFDQYLNIWKSVL